MSEAERGCEGTCGNEDVEGLQGLPDVDRCEDWSEDESRETLGFTAGFRRELLRG